MTLAAIETPSRSTPSLLSDNSATGTARSETGEFGQVMSEVMQPAGQTVAPAVGQDIPVNPTGMPSFEGAVGGTLGVDFLKAIHLGPHMNVITSDATVPDEQSLEAFARAQGLDETAVQWLMGTPPTGLTPHHGALTLTTSPSGLSPTAAAGNALTDGLTPPTGEAASGVNPTLNLASAPAGAPASTSAITPPSAGVAVPGVNLPPLAAGQALPDAPADAPLNAMTAAALWAMAQSTEKAQVNKPAQTTPTPEAQVQINLMASAAPAAVWMLRNPLAMTPTKTSVTPSDRIAQSEIDLSQLVSPELLETLIPTSGEGGGTGAAGEQPTPLSGHSGHRLELAATARQTTQNPDASAAAPDTGTAQRSENIQNLAEKMGQAVGQRILSEIEKGQWHLKLSLRPATLGHIEVEMRMRSGELDAVFTAPQALTRELLQEGMSKLKDTLNQMGMDVALMQVGDGQTRQRGGESTPGQMSKSTNGNSDDAESSPATSAAPAPAQKMGQDGWDVLV